MILGEKRSVCTPPSLLHNFTQMWQHNVRNRRLGPVYVYKHKWPYFFFSWRCDPKRVMASSFLRFLDHTRRTTVGRTPLDKWSARRTDLYLTTQNTHNRQTSMPPVGFEPTISAGERPQTYDLDRAATGTGQMIILLPHLRRAWGQVQR